MPEPVELRAQRADPGRVEVIDAARAGGPVADQPGVFEHLQVLRDRWSADRQLAGEFADRAWSLGQALEDRAPRSISERAPFVSSLVSVYER